MFTCAAILMGSRSLTGFVYYGQVWQEYYVTWMPSIYSGTELM